MATTRRPWLTFVGRHTYAGIGQRTIHADRALQEREQAKRRHLAVARGHALHASGVVDTTAAPTAALSTIAFHHAFTRWVTAEQEGDLGTLAVAVLDELRAVAV
ncbi:hypothetical protein MUN77_03810 [Leucobacter allii]|uniref:hypothetical protein n=1 Tax=Leucobacter allii TaxID=2932247 RepID=UPI001FD46A13|nr:hypothetical protein [Leucobacter allii]UOR02445.1 hypothetical protein MUN77_03810 [Leucobacter allii]